MEKSKEYKISIALSSVALVLLCVAFVTGLIPEINPSVEKICLYLGIALNFLGFAYLKKSKDNMVTR